MKILIVENIKRYIINCAEFLLTYVGPKSQILNNFYFFGKLHASISDHPVQNLQVLKLRIEQLREALTSAEFI